MMKIRVCVGKGCCVELKECMGFSVCRDFNKFLFVFLPEDAVIEEMCAKCVYTGNWPEHLNIPKFYMNEILEERKEMMATKEVRNI